MAQENAIEAAQNYVDIMPFSRAGLIDQLSSEYGSQFPMQDAEFAVDHIKVNWRAEAVEAAKQYLDTMAFSRQGLIEQFASPYGSQFSVETAHVRSQPGWSRSGLIARPSTSAVHGLRTEPGGLALVGLGLLLQLVGGLMT